MTAGATGSILTHPIWVVKTRVMVRMRDPLLSSPKCSRRTVTFFLVIRTVDSTCPRGPISPYSRGVHSDIPRGRHACLLSRPDTQPSWSHSRRCTIPPLRGAEIGLGYVYNLIRTIAYLIVSPIVCLADRRNINVPALSSIEIFICSSISKMVATVITYPHEVVRTRLQIDYGPVHPPPPPPPSSSPASSTSSPNPSSNQSRKPHALSFGSMVDTTKVILQENGWRGLYRGLSVNLLRTVPSSVITLVTCVALWAPPLAVFCYSLVSSLSCHSK